MSQAEHTRSKFRLDLPSKPEIRHAARIGVKPSVLKRRPQAGGIELARFLAQEVSPESAPLWLARAGRDDEERPNDDVVIVSRVHSLQSKAQFEPKTAPWISSEQQLGNYMLHTPMCAGVDGSK